MWRIIFIALTFYLPSEAIAAPVIAAIAAIEIPTWASIGLFALKTIGAIVISSVLNRVFTPHPKQPNFSQAAQDFGVMVRSSIESHKIVYGQAKVSGPLVFVATTSDTNQFLHMAIALTGHEIDSFETIYFNEIPLSVNASGWVTSGGYPKTTSSVTQSVSTLSRTDGIVTITTGAAHGFSAADQVVMANTGIASCNGTFVIASVPSSTTFTYATGGDNATSSGGTATDTTNNSATDSYARIKLFTGSPTQTASSDMMAEIPGWDSNHRLQGIAYVYVRLEYNHDLFAQGIPNVSAVINGKKVYDPRSGLTVWSDNAALCIRDYLTSDYGFNADSTEINDTYFTSAANHCDESVTLTTGGSQNRYTCNGVLDTASAPVDNLNGLVAALAGTVTYVQGQFRCYAGVYDSPVGDITTDMLAGGVKIQARTARQQLFNAVQGTYTDPNKNWQPTDFPPVTNDTYTAQDSQQIFQDIQLPFTNHPEAAQRIGKVILEQGRQGIILDLTLKHSALPYAVWDTFTYTDPYLGWDHKVFRIRKLSTTGTGPISITAQEEASTAYDWSSGDATTFDSAPDTNLPNPFSVAVPTGVAFNSRLISSTGTDKIFELALQWDAHPDYFVGQGGGFEVQFKLSSDTTWRPSFFVNGGTTLTDVAAASANLSYDLRIRARNNLGAVSGWVTLLGAVVGTSGGVGTTNDWGNWTSSVGPTNNWDNWTDAVGTTNDWGFFT